MPVFNNILAGAAGSGGAADFKIERSLRFNDDDQAYLSKNVGSAGDQRRMTFSFWIKRHNIYSGGYAIFAQDYATSPSNHVTDRSLSMLFESDRLELYDYGASSGSGNSGSVQAWTSGKVQEGSGDVLFRDPSAWYHIVFAIDTTQSTAANRCKVWINGVQRTMSGYPVQNSYLSWGQVRNHYIGIQKTNGSFTRAGDFSLADVHFIDGQQLSNTDFGKFDATTGVWNPIEFTGHNAKHRDNWNNNTTGTGFNSSTGKENAFDGNASTQAAPGQGGTMSFTPAQAITGITKVRIKARRDAGQATPSNFTLNGTTIGDLWTAGTTATVEISSLGGSAITQLTNLTWKANTNNNEWFGVYQIEIFYDGAYHTLVQGGVNGFHLDFSDNSSASALGNDAAGSNNWTVNNLNAEASTHAVAGTHQNRVGISFNGTNASIELSSNSDLNPGSGVFTLEAYAYALSGGNAELGIYDGTTSGASGQLVIRRVGSGTIMLERANQAFDISGGQMSENSWHHVAVTRDGSNNVRLFLDGVLQGTSTNNTQNYQGHFRIGRTNNAFTNGYVSNLRLIKGSCLYTSNFTPPSLPLGNVSGTTLLMAQSTSSATAATVKPSGVTISGPGDGGAGIDSLLDSPTNYEASSGNNGGNYATWNPLDKNSSVTLSDGNLQAVCGTQQGVNGTIALPSSGKYYFEIEFDAYNAAADTFAGLMYLPQASGTRDVTAGGTRLIIRASGGILNNSSSTSSGSSFGAGDILGVACDCGANSIQLYKNGSSIGSAQTLSPAPDGTNWAPYCSSSGGACTFILNTGQRAFAHTPPTGYKSLCTTNLPDPLIADGSTAFDVIVTPSGTGADRTFTMPGGFGPDLVWSKSRNNNYHHALFDTVRGAKKALQANLTNAENTQNGQVKSFTSDGFVNGSDIPNTSGESGVYWAWDGGDLVQSSNNLQTETWSAATGALAAESFDGSTSTQGSMVNEQWYKVAGSLTVSSSMRMYLRRDQQYKMRINGGTEFNANTRDNSSNNNRGWTSIAIPTGTHTNVEIKVTGGGDYIEAIEVDGKLMVDPGVIPVGGLNSSVYDTSEYWVTTGTVTGTPANSNYTFSPLFDGDLTSLGPQSSTMTQYVYTFANTLSATANTIIFYSTDNTANVPSANTGGYYINGTQVTTSNCTKLNSSSPYKYRMDGLTTLSSIGTQQKGNLTGIEVNGKLLVDSNAHTLPNVPSIASTVRANPSAGFSIVTYTGNSDSSKTIGHGLNAAIEMMMIKCRNATSDWTVYHKSTGNNAFCRLNLDNSDDLGGTGVMNATSPTSSVFTVGDYSGTGGASRNFVAYCFTSVEGYSAFGSYTGNGLPNGPFVYTGFRPAFLLIKNADTAARNWFIYDTSRVSENPNKLYLRPNLSNGEATISDGIDFLSNGFKLRQDSTSHSGSGHNMIYAAFAENPFKTARAR